LYTSAADWAAAAGKVNIAAAIKVVSVNMVLGMNISRYQLRVSTCMKLANTMPILRP
jgi:hypothetical protein